MSYSFEEFKCMVNNALNIPDLEIKKMGIGVDRLGYMYSGVKINNNVYRFTSDITEEEYDEHVLRTHEEMELNIDKFLTPYGTSMRLEEFFKFIQEK